MSFEISRDAYDRHVGRYSTRLAEALIERTGVRDGDRALDVGCGPGAVTEQLAVRLGGAAVAAVDPSKSFTTATRARVPEADVRLGAAESLPFAEREFDVVTSQLVVNFMRDPIVGVAEMARVSRRVVSSCVWDYAEGMTMLRAFWDAAHEIDSGAPDQAQTMRNTTPGELGELWRAAGLRDVQTDELLVEAAYADFADFWSPFPDGPGPTGAYASSLDPERREALREAIFRRVGEPDGPFTLSARAWFVRGSVEQSRGD
jgi:SAM-dependent methyltransferase